MISPYDAVALEAALRIKEEIGGNVTVISLGNLSAEAVVRKALAMGADSGTLVSDPSFNLEDSIATIHVLMKAIKKIGNYDLIFCGRQAVDWDRGITGPFLAEYLSIPVVTLAKAIKISDRKIRIERMIADGIEVVETTLPVVVTVSNEYGQARIPSGWGVIKAAKAEIPVWGAKDIATERAGTENSPIEGKLLRLYIPAYERKCEFLKEEKPEDLAAVLVSRIREHEMA